MIPHARPFLPNRLESFAPFGHVARSLGPMGSGRSRSHWQHVITKPPKLPFTSTNESRGRRAESSCAGRLRSIRASGRGAYTNTASLCQPESYRLFISDREPVCQPEPIACLVADSQADFGWTEFELPPTDRLEHGRRYRQAGGFPHLSWRGASARFFGAGRRFFLRPCLSTVASGVEGNGLSGWSAVCIRRR